MSRQLLFTTIAILATVSLAAQENRSAHPRAPDLGDRLRLTDGGAPWRGPPQAHYGALAGVRIRTGSYLCNMARRRGADDWLAGASGRRLVCESRLA